jgi:hypothetical protein
MVFSNSDIYLIQPKFTMSAFARSRLAASLISPPAMDSGSSAPLCDNDESPNGVGATLR